MKTSLQKTVRVHTCLLSSVIFILSDFSLLFLAVDFLRNLFSRNLGIGTPDKVLDELTLDGVAQYIKSGKCEILAVFIKRIHDL